MTIDDNTHTGLTWTELPAPVATYLSMRPNGSLSAALAVFTDDAVVIDEGNTYRGRDQIREWMDRTSSEYSYTTKFIGANRIDESRIDVVQHLEGDFPGGVIDLHFRFAFDGTSISRLTIEP
ncbi:nuclear transport factor 2 family protein [Mycolicibacterium goodii]|uniref:Nuclear transport factor 2 family protein n=1 Tax=Mycolicibacterium goodii TaxID=134601 RepID=A0ABS6HUG1_MYCGD|nr:nuclear transport factor 2 family protein [Mycolicibacterium goodii]OKH62978.1 hypothetical protein EB74_14870 [Mycobacterium sp. SWH-M5]MBU8816685.1 nuclear transport factor 2 family protein [Mycolicibacterium goodii]MBU8826281.1 nuclear transport factor 2 family protein [Mycolicibacterium goodii]MBU8839654.1 nuclear transport factor 2 family protein [Mycolicibacterium goodii]ULN44981.1 nuclear transport factor 2 family protein [Mycolicibacterium goodii]